MSLGPIELAIRQLPGVLACQFTATDVFVLVEPSVDPEWITTAVDEILGGAAEARRVAVVGGTPSVAAGIHRHRGLSLVSVAAATVLAAASVTAGASGLLDIDFAGNSHPIPSASAPVRLAPNTGSPTRRVGVPFATAAPAIEEAPVAPVTVVVSPTPVLRHEAHLVRVALPAPLPSLVATQPV